VVTFGFSTTQSTTKGHHLKSTTEKLIKARMGMLALAEQLNNVSAAGRRAGISRSHYYEIKEAFEKFGAEGLAPQTRGKPRMPNQTPPELEAQILEITLSQLQLFARLRSVEAGRHRRFTVHRAGGVAAARPHASHSPATVAGAENGDARRHSHRMPDPLAAETSRTHRRSRTARRSPVSRLFAVPGHLLHRHHQRHRKDLHAKRGGRARSLGFSKLYLSKVPMTAVDVLNDRVLPFYEEHSAEVEHLLTDNGRQFCGRELKHHFELFLAISQIAHRRTEVRSPQTNGFCQRFHRTIQEEFFSAAFRNTIYESVAQLQQDLDRYLDFYNREHAHRGYRTQGRTPLQAFLDGLILRPRREAA